MFADTSAFDVKRSDEDGGFMRPQLLRLSITLFLTGVGTSLFGAPQAVPPPRTKIDVSKLGPQVGERVPDFSLKDQNGNTQTLQSIMGPRGAMLVFVRSADW